MEGFMVGCLISVIVNGRIFNVYFVLDIFAANIENLLRVIRRYGLGVIIYG